MDLRALDGITISRDCRSDAMALQRMPDAQVPLEISDQPDTTEMARTVAVWLEKELRFHIVLRAAVGLMALFPGKTCKRWPTPVSPTKARMSNTKAIYSEPSLASIAVRWSAVSVRGKHS
jgi:hypothetical protein